MVQRDDTFEHSLKAARDETRASFENRGLMYAYLFDELEAELGTQRAVRVMKRAIYRRGLEVAERYREAAEQGDLAEVGRLFVEGSPCGGGLFHPAAGEAGGNGVVLTMSSCPLVDAWHAAGYSESKIDILCDIAAEVDMGTFQGAGLDLEFLERQAQPDGTTCRLHLTVRGGSAGS